MTKDQITTFLSIVQCKSISKAGKRLFLAQSTVSNRLKELEEELGVKLIHRVAGRSEVSLTPKGEEFIKFAQGFLDYHREVEEWSIKKARHKMNFDSTASINSCILVDFYGILIGQGDMFLEIHNYHTDRIFDRVEKLEADIGVVPKLLRAKHIRSIPLFEEELKLITYATDLPKEVDIEEMRDEQMITFDWGQLYQEWSSLYMGSLNPMAHVDDIHLLLSLLNVPGTYALAPPSVFKHSKEIKVSAIKKHPPKRRCYLIHSTHLPENKKRLIPGILDDLRNYLSTHHAASLTLL